MQVSPTLVERLMAFLSNRDNSSSSLDTLEDLYHFTTHAAPGMNGSLPPPLQSAGWMGLSVAPVIYISAAA